jgi:hypothetical protein
MGWKHVTSHTLSPWLAFMHTSAKLSWPGQEANLACGSPWLEAKYKALKKTIWAASPRGIRHIVLEYTSDFIVLGTYFPSFQFNHYIRAELDYFHSFKTSSLSLTVLPTSK